MTEPQWLLWARQLQSIAQTSLTFANPYDVERYEAIQVLSAQMMAAHTGTSPQVIADIYEPRPVGACAVIEGMFAHHADPQLAVDYD